jgi:PAS domain-containing protein
VFLDGTTNWYEFIVNPVPEGIFVLSLDITDRKRVLEALMESEETLREAQSLARLGNWRFDLLTNKFTCSDELLRILELSPDEFGDTFEEFLCMIHIDDRAYVVSVYKKSIEDRVSTHVSHRVLLRNGSIKSVVQQFTTFYDSSGRPVRSVGTVQDVTSREGTWER